MRALIQRVTKASVEFQGQVIAEIGKGILLFLGIGIHDNEEDSKKLAEKIPVLRIFDDENGKMNLSLLDIKGELLIVSQFTLFGDCRKGRRPGFDEAMKPDLAKLLYEDFLSRVSTYGIAVKSGRFQEMMQVHLINDGPVTFILDTSI